MGKDLKLKGGMLLVAEPFMNDGFFNRTVVLLCEHTRRSSFGFVLNKRLDININDILVDFPDMDSEVFCGGPVSNDNLYYLHNVGDLIEDSSEIAPGIFWGGDFNTLRTLIDTKIIESQNIRFFVGYSGWDKEQLDQEFADKSWVIAEPDPKYIFENQVPYQDMWEDVLAEKGNTFSVIAQIPKGLTWN